MGSLVRGKPGVSPTYSWGSVASSSIGIIINISGSDCTVNFPEDSTWRGVVAEMEAIEASQATWEWEDGNKGSGDWKPCAPQSPFRAHLTYFLWRRVWS